MPVTCVLYTSPARVSWLAQISISILRMILSLDPLTFGLILWYVSAPGRWSGSNLLKSHGCELRAGAFIPVDCVNKNLPGFHTGTVLHIANVGQHNFQHSPAGVFSAGAFYIAVGIYRFTVASAGWNMFLTGPTRSYLMSERYSAIHALGIL